LKSIVANMAHYFKRVFMHTSYLRLTDLRPAGLWFAGFWLVAALVLISNPVLAAQKNTAAPPPKAGSIVKWVDEKGVTHYGDSIPVQYSGRDNSELDRQGRVVKRNKAGDSQANKAVVEEAKVSVEQQRHDNALLAAYTTEQEFDLARDRNLQMDEAAVQGLNQRMGSAKDRLAATKKIADGFNQRKKPVPDYVTQDLKENQNEIAKIETQIAEKQQSMDATRQRFEKDKQRFIELKRDPNAPPPATAPAPVATPAAGPAPEAAKPTPAPAAPVAPTATPAAAKPAATAAAPATKPVPASAAKPATINPVKKKPRVVMP
jgi:hypothetical protein